MPSGETVNVSGTLLLILDKLREVDVVTIAYPSSSIHRSSGIVCSRYEVECDNESDGFQRSMQAFKQLIQVPVAHEKTGQQILDWSQPDTISAWENNRLRSGGGGTGSLMGRH